MSASRRPVTPRSPPPVVVIDVADDLGSAETHCGQGSRPGTGGGVQPFHLESVTAGGDGAVPRIDGEIDAYAAPQIRERALDLARDGTVHIIADLRGAGFPDSAGLAALVSSRTGLGVRGGSPVLAASTGPIQQIFPITGISDSFGLQARVLDALTAGQHWPAVMAGEGDSTGEWCRHHRLL